MDGSNNDDTMSCSFVRAIKRLDCPYKLAWHGIRHSFTQRKAKAWHGCTRHLLYRFPFANPLPFTLGARNRRGPRFSLFFRGRVTPPTHSRKIEIDSQDAKTTRRRKRKKSARKKEEKIACLLFFLHVFSRRPVEIPMLTVLGTCLELVVLAGNQRKIMAGNPERASLLSFPLKKGPLLLSRAALSPLLLVLLAP